MKAVRLPLATVLAMTVLPSCRDRTEIVLIIDSDLLIPTELDRVDVTVDGPSSHTSTAKELEHSAILPLTLGIEAQGDASSVSITTVGSLSGQELVRNAVRTEFVHGEIRSLTLLLLRSCAHVTCDGDWVCTSGVCGPSTRPGESLPSWSGVSPIKLPATDGSADASASPILVWAGGDSTCAVDAAGVFFCWGADDSGQLGLGSTGDVTRPSRVVLPTDIASWAAGPSHACMCTRAGSVYCVGANGDGQLGNNTMNASTVPAPVDGMADCSGIATGPNRTCALRSGGEVVCWGGGAAQMEGASLPSPAAQVAVGTSSLFACARLRDGTVQCWGDNTSGQLGAGISDPSRTTPVAVAGIADATDLSLGGAFACAARRNGRLVCWGANDHGQLGNDTTAHTILPVEVAGVSEVVQVALGLRSACARESTGRLYCWGQNDFGNVGNGTTEDMATPTLVAGDFVAVTAGRAHVCGVRRSGGLACWGANEAGQLGDGTTEDRLLPNPVPGF